MSGGLFLDCRAVAICPLTPPTSTARAERVRRTPRAQLVTDLPPPSASRQHSGVGADSRAPSSRSPWPSTKAQFRPGKGRGPISRRPRRAADQILKIWSHVLEGVLAWRMPSRRSSLSRRRCGLFQAPVGDGPSRRRYDPMSRAGGAEADWRDLASCHPRRRRTPLAGLPVGEESGGGFQPSGSRGRALERGARSCVNLLSAGEGSFRLSATIHLEWRPVARPAAGLSRWRRKASATLSDHGLATARLGSDAGSWRLLVRS